MKEVEKNFNTILLMDRPPQSAVTGTTMSYYASHADVNEVEKKHQHEYDTINHSANV
jgi:hypothetical protein